MHHYRLGVIGNPISHSLSPQIHQQFARQFDHQIDYRKYLVEENDVDSFIKSFFNDGGHGLNVTMPHKHSAMAVADYLTESAKRAGSVNTLFIDKQGLIGGDTTDGGGLLLHLQSLGFSVKGKKVLIIGAGGASQSVIAGLLGVGATLALYNRNLEKRDQVIEQFSPFGDVGCFDASTSFEASSSFAGIISCVSHFSPEFMAPIKPFLKRAKFVYDLNYGSRAQAFINCAQAAGCQHWSDGLGMLIGQAALSYQRWTGRLADLKNIQVAES